MARQTWTLADLDGEVYAEQFEAGAGELPPGCAIRRRTLRGGLADGVDVVRLNNGQLALDVLPTRGMGVWKAWCGDLEIGWQSPVKGPVHPRFVSLWEPSGIGWLDGFDELLVRCGLESNGAPEFDANGRLLWPLHGRIANKPAHRVTAAADPDTGEIEVTGEVDEARLFGNKLRLTTTYRLRAGQPAVTVIDQVRNLSAERGELQLLYHINVGAPLAMPGSRVVLAAAKVAPRDAAAVGNLADWDRYGPEMPGAPEAVFFFELLADEAGRTKVLLKNPDGERGLLLRFSTRQLPRFVLWKNRHAAADGYVTGLEPAVNFPNVRSFEKRHGRVVELAAGESRTFELKLTVCRNAAEVAAAEEEIDHLQHTAPRQVLGEPDTDWSA